MPWHVSDFERILIQELKCEIFKRSPNLISKNSNKMAENTKFIHSSITSQPIKLYK